jgi:hypothetical protein
MTVNDHIERDLILIMDADLMGDEGKKRHLIDELDALESWKYNHPGDDHDPTSLELYCDAHPDACECRIYED